jgi:5-methylthioribose kinase
MKITLSEEFDEKLNDYLIRNKLITSEENVLSYEKAGEGNMNFVMRLVKEGGTFILKQSREYVNKYPQIPAPIERVVVERSFFELVNKDAFLAELSPSVLRFDEANHLLVMEDLGTGSDCLGLYQDPSILNTTEIEGLIAYLIHLHKLRPSSFPDNGEMKKLNHEHIFYFPFMVENGFNLDDIQPGLQELAMIYKNNKELKKSIDKLGTQYLNKGNTLLHGDFYPGSWLKVGNGLKVIDPEFGFMGDAEFDLGVMLAHFQIASVEANILNLCKNTYLNEAQINISRLNQYTGVEIMRRLIGIAQLPTSLSLSQKKELLDLAQNLILKNE